MTWIGAWFFQKFWDAYGAVDALPDACPLGFLTLFISALAPWSATGNLCPPKLVQKYGLIQAGAMVNGNIELICVCKVPGCMYINILTVNLLRYLFRY